MTDEELIARLREQADKRRKGNRFDSMEYEAADRIEALVKERDEAVRAERQTYRDAVEVCARAEAAEAEVEKLRAERDAAEHLARMRKGFIEEARDERDAAEARISALTATVERMRGALEAIYEITVEPAETDHKNVRGWIEVTARAAITEEK